MSQIDNSDILTVEKAILASFMMEGRTDESVGWLLSLKQDMFVDSFNRRVFSAIASLSLKNMDFDIISLSHALKIDAMPLTLIQETIVSTSETKTWIEILKDAWSRRCICQRCKEISSLTLKQEKTVSEICGTAERYMSEIGTVNIDHSNLTANDIILKAAMEMQDDFQNAQSGKQSSQRIKFGIPWLDKSFLLLRGDVFVLTAYQGHGKTSLALQSFRSQLKNMKVAYFCTETTAEALMKKMWASSSGHSYRDVLEPKNKQTYLDIMKESVNFQKFENNFRIWGSLETNRDMDSICYLSRKAKSSMGGLDMIWIDHLHDLKLPVEFRTGKRTRDEGIGENVQKGKMLAAQLNCAVGFLAQMDKASRQEKRPGMSALRGSSVIIDVASTIAFLYNTHKAGTEFKPKQECELYTDKSRDEGGFFMNMIFDGITRNFYPTGWESGEHKYSQNDGVVE